MSENLLPLGRARGRGRGQQHEQPGPSGDGGDGDGRRDPTRGAGSGVVHSGGYSDVPRVRPGVPVGAPSAARATAQATHMQAAGGDAGRSYDIVRGARRGNRAITDLTVTRPKNLNTKKGCTGGVISLVANYFKMSKSAMWNIYKYRVDFAPDIELLGARKAIMRRQIERLGSFQFDGTMLFTPFQISSDPMVIVEKDDQDQPVRVSLRGVGELLATDAQYTHLLNLIMRSTIESLNMQKAYGPKGTKYFDALQKIEIREHNLQVWPGFATSIRQHETEIMMCTEVTHKVIRMESCYAAMQEQGRDIDSIKKLLIGQTVVTEYNNATYRIDDVDFSLTPSSSFEKKSGERITFIEYFRDRYNRSIRDTRPLKKKNR